MQFYANATRNDKRYWIVAGAAACACVRTILSHIFDHYTFYLGFFVIVCV